MIRRAIVTSVDDPKGLGRIQTHVLGVCAERMGLTPWLWPCAPLAGQGSGFFCLPQVGDEVWVDRTDDGDWLYLGFSWRGDQMKPAEGSATVRVFRTPAGHKIAFDEHGDVEIANQSGCSVLLKADGQIMIGTGNGGKRVLTEDFVTSFNAHTHSGAGSGPPATPVVNAPPYVTSITRIE